MSGPFDHFPRPGYLSEGGASQETPPPSLEGLRAFLADRARNAPHLHGLQALNVLDEELRGGNSGITFPRRTELRWSEPSQFATMHDRRLAAQARLRLNWLPQNSSMNNNEESQQSASNPTRTRANTGHHADHASSQGGLRPPGFGGLQTLQQVDDRLRHAHTSINDLLDEEMENFIRSPLQPVLRDHSDNEDDLERPRAKRVKLNADDNREGPRRFRYGHYGQVVPRALDMEIASCDGGSYEAHGKSSSPKNILVDDHTVYCTKSDRCNIILKHEGEIPFCLKKLVIKAPRSGFDSPYSVREGMVFVAMNSDDLLSRTTQYQIAYAPSSRRRMRAQYRRSHNNDSAQASANNAVQQTILDTLQAAYRDVERGNLSRLQAVLLEERNRVLSNRSSNGNDRYARRQTSTHGLRVTTDHDDASEDEITDDGRGNDDFSPPLDANVDEEDQMTQLLAADDSDSDGSEDSDNDDISSSFLPHQQNRERDASPPSELIRLANQVLDVRPREQRRGNHPAARHANQPSSSQTHSSLHRQASSFNIEPTSSFNESAEHGDEPSSLSAPEVMKPLARFSIRREKSMVSVKFDPPASGRFILIKLWSPCSGGNIDIQSVVAKGFVGPRFFPSIEFR